MPKPLRLGISGSSFVNVMPSEILSAAYLTALRDRPGRLDDRQNRMMADFMRDLMRAVSSCGIEAMECYHSTSWDDDLVLQPVEEARGVELWSVHAPYGRYFDPSSPDEEARESAVAGLLDTVAVARRLGIELVVVHPGANIDYDVPKRARLDLAVQSLSRAADVAAEDGVALVVEPLPKNEPGNSLDEVMWIIAQINRPNVGINFDVNHVFPPEEMPGLIRRAGSQVMSVHISDQDGQERHWMPFEGRLDWKGIVESLRQIGYRGPLIYEAHVKGAKSCEEVARAVVENYRRLAAVGGVGC